MRSTRLQRQRGAALLTAMVIVTLVATLAGAMVWQQWRAVQVEAAERSRSQAQWIVTGAVDWARLILREDARTGGADHLGEPWAVPLAEAKLSTFLAADRDNSDDAPDAFLSGSITDAQSRYNLRHLLDVAAGTPAAAAEEKVLQRLLEFAGGRGDLASQIARSLRQASPAATAAAAAAAQATAASGTGTATVVPTVTAPADAPLMPERISQLAWFGIDAKTLAQIAPFVTLLPSTTPVNVNTAPKEVLAAVIPGLDLSGAERIVQTRQRKPFITIATDLVPLLPQGTQLAATALSTSSNYFEIAGRLRLEDRIVEERTLVFRQNLNVVPVRRERVANVERTP